MKVSIKQPSIVTWLINALRGFLSSCDIVALIMVRNSYSALASFINILSDTSIN